MARRSGPAPVFKPEYAVLGYLRDGRFAAVAAAIAVLHARGLVATGRAGTVQRSEKVTAPPEGFERVVWGSVHGFVSPGALMSRPSVDAALTDLRRRARRLGLVRPLVPVRTFMPARTRAGRELLDSAFLECRWPPSPEADSRPVEHRVGAAVALYGNVALNVLMPDFARASGLLDRSSEDPKDYTSQAPGPTAYM